MQHTTQLCVCVGVCVACVLPIPFCNCIDMTLVAAAAAAVVRLSPLLIRQIDSSLAFGFDLLIRFAELGGFLHEWKLKMSQGIQLINFKIFN